MSVAFVFPGQGAQKPEFLDRLPDHPAVAATICEASAILGCDVRDLDSSDALRSTAVVQLTIVVAGVAAHRALAQHGVVAEAVAGLSVGAYTAAVACGALRFADALSVVRLRGELMERAYPEGYGMGAIIGLDERRVLGLIERVSQPQSQVYLANLNAPTQFVVAGTDAGVEAVIELAKKEGARRAERLAVNTPSHTPLLAHVADELERALADIAVANARVPYITNRRARATREAAEIRADLARSVMYPVRWDDGSRVLYELGTRLFIEVAPGRVLTDLVEVAFTDVRAVAVEDTRLATIAVLAERERRRESSQSRQLHSDAR
jgi:malonate decarboxylase epsilon subunit